MNAGAKCLPLRICKADIMRLVEPILGLSGIPEYAELPVMLMRTAVFR